MGNVYQLPRRYDVRKSPRRLARKPKAPVVDITIRFKRDTLLAPAEAYRLYLRASEIDDDEPERAQAIYEQALKLDPGLAIAWTNLGNMHFRLHRPERAEWHYEHALKLDPRQPEATYNLGYLRLEQGQVSEAITLLDRAIELDHEFADAHFNLAMAFEQYDSPIAAQRHWKAFLKLNPTGTWADIARRHLLDDTDTPKLRLVQP
jgi:tetratricopeptide (TPR) repeat protein